MPRMDGWIQVGQYTASFLQLVTYNTTLYGNFDGPMTGVGGILAWITSAGRSHGQLISLYTNAIST